MNRFVHEYQANNQQNYDTVIMCQSGNHQVMNDSGQLVVIWKLEKKEEGALHLYTINPHQSFAFLGRRQEYLTVLSMLMKNWTVNSDNFGLWNEREIILFFDLASKMLCASPGKRCDWNPSRSWLKKKLKALVAFWKCRNTALSNLAQNSILPNQPAYHHLRFLWTQFNSVHPHLA